MWTKIDRCIAAHDMLKETDRLVLGLSGGADSLCLACYFLQLRDKGGPELHAVHVNHLLRGDESERDQAFVERFCRERHLPLTVFRKNVEEESRKSGESLEEAGRRIRYACFKEIMDSYPDGRVRLAVAHHADDQAETVLFRLIRGTGPAGLVGIRPVKGRIIRPLFNLRREEILKILARLGQEYVTDSSNGDCYYSRNDIRLSLLPKMEQMNPRAADHLCRLAGQIDDLLAYVEPGLAQLAEDMINETEDGWEIRTKSLLSLPAYARTEILRRALCLAAGYEKDIGSVHVRQLLDLAGKKEGKENAFPYNVTAVRKGDRLILCRNLPAKKSASGCRLKASVLDEGGRTGTDAAAGCLLRIKLPPYKAGTRWTAALPGNRCLHFSYEDYQGGPIAKSDCMERFDYDTIKDDIYIRTRREGDYFVFDQQGRRKRLSRYFIDARIPADERDRRLLLAEGSHVIWIPGGRISEAYKIKPVTERMLVVSLTAKETGQ